MKLIGICLFLFTIGIANANRQGDSLKAIEYSDLAFHYQDIDPDSSLRYARLTLELSNRWNWLQLQAYSLSDIGNYYRLQEDFPLAREYYTQSLNIRQKIGDTNDMASAYKHLGSMYRQWGLYDSSEYYYYKGLLLTSENNRYSRMYGIIENDLAMTLMDQGKYQDAEDKIISALGIAKEHKDRTVLAQRYHTLANLYLVINRFQWAEEYYLMALEIYQAEGNLQGQIDVLINQAGVYLNLDENEQAIPLLTEAIFLSDSLGLLDNRAVIYNNLGLAYLKLGNLSEAEPFLENGHLLAINTGNHRTQLRTGFNLIRLYLQFDEVTRASNLVEELDKIVRQKEYIAFLPEFLALKSQVLSEHGNFEKALRVQLEYEKIRDSLELVIDQSQQSLIRNEIYEREHKLHLQEKKTTIAEKETAELKNSLLLSITLLLSILFIGYIIMQWRIQKSEREKKKSEQQFLKLRNQVDVKLLESYLKASKDTGTRIGRDLHDKLGSKLAVVQFSLEGMRKLNNDPRELDKRFVEAEQLLDESCKDLRLIAHDLLDQQLEDRELETELKNYIRIINDLDIVDVSFSSSNIPTQIDEAIKQNVVALTRLFVENVFRHAQAASLQIHLKFENNQILLEIKDDGIGFKHSNNSQGWGLKNAQNRVEQLGGKSTCYPILAMALKLASSFPYQLTNHDTRSTCRRPSNGFGWTRSNSKGF
ncbi:tetratricopeptide repeat protein [bacterium SCSIO 12741]|nr:tetratricopeptide repeat protein [bacterium SCSIO 12741]